ncbi:MAG: HAMP domain-containing sensor histidine kinase [Planctomycetota bacterium]
MGTMSGIMRSRRTLHFPITLSVVLMVLNVALMVCWIVLLAQLYWWSALTVGTVIFVVILVGLVLYLILAIKEIRLNQRQANFVDSVTHELKSPIASLRLYLETLQLRTVNEEKREYFYQVMVDDLDRLDRLINQLLEVGRLDAVATEAVQEDIAMEPLLKECAHAACMQYKRPDTSIRFETVPAVVRGGKLALEMIFRNLLDNAFKYSGEEPEVEVQMVMKGNHRVITRISDNGPGVPLDIRKKIFGLFYRGGTELTRSKKGTGLGLYIVYTLVRKMGGKVSVHGRGKSPGSVFEVELPGRIESCES